MNRPRIAAALGVLVTLVAAAPAAAISGGHPSPSPYSFMGSLQRLDAPRDDLHACGVSLIAPQWAVTAGHCARSAADVVGTPTSGHPAGWKVRFGSLRVDSGGQLVDVAQFVQRNNRYFDHDLALLRLAEPVRLAPIAIADATPVPGTPARIMGWGQTCDGSAPPECSPDVLQEADTQIQPTKTCDPVVAADLCVGSLDGKVSPLNMDSGGPALVMERGVWKVAGSVEGGGGGTPAIYTSLVDNRAWIDAYVSGAKPIPADTPFPSNALSGTAAVGGCSGAVVRGPRSQGSDPAMVLTNGHCLEDRPDPGQALVDRPLDRAVFVEDRHGVPAARTHATRLLYGTLTGTDVALLRLDTTYAQLAAKHVRIRGLATRGPKVGDRLHVLSSVSSRDWTCRVQAIVPELREGGYRQFDSLRYRTARGCAVATNKGPGPGDSGSPLVDRRSGLIVGVHATSNQDGEHCTANNPCEGDTSTKGRRYGQQTAALPACLRAGSRVDLGRRGCTLTRRGAARP